MQIVADILRVAKKGAKKTKIVYSTNLNFKMVSEYLEKLERAGLITKEDRGLIRATQKGKKYLYHFHGLSKFGIS